MRRPGAWLVLAAGALWGTTGTAQALAPPGATPAAVGALRLALGGAGLLAVALLRGELRQAGRLPGRAVAAAAVTVAAYQVCFFSGVSLTGVALGTVVGIGSSPVWAGLLAWLTGGGRPARRWVLATGLAVAGVILLIAGGRTLRVSLPGVMLALAAGASYAIYASASKRLLESASPDAVMAVVFGLAALLLAPILLQSNLAWVGTPRGAAVALHLGLLATTLSYLLFARGLRSLSAPTAVTLSLAEPLTAAGLGLLVLQERLTLAGVLGGGLLLAGLISLSWQPRSQP
ncbi:MAG TPA: DMT family transporter [Anaerolineales bacterium]|nr:DMT family transporter [Anaerolineales bacterium]